MSFQILGTFQHLHHICSISTEDVMTITGFSSTTILSFGRCMSEINCQTVLYDWAHTQNKHCMSCKLKLVEDIQRLLLKCINKIQTQYSAIGLYVTSCNL